MPSESKSRHPSGAVLTFRESDHTYIDDSGRHYLSASGILKTLWPPFDAKAQAARVAIRDGKTTAQVLGEWSAKGEWASRYGTKIHEIFEQTIADHLGRPVHVRHKIEATDHARAQFVARKVIERATSIQGTEVVVFSPDYQVAGTIDLLAEFPDFTLIGDAKSNEFAKLSPHHDGHRSYNRNERYGLDDSKLTRYALQLAIYEWILRRDYGYGQTKPFKRIIFHVPSDAPSMQPEFYELPDLQATVQRIMDDSLPAWAVTA
jgi:ATP-dependent exoDNAse (exonuclease V) beta subunit